MSHVVGQGTIASNHYRTPEYRASQYQQPVAQPVAQPVEQFNSESLEFEAAERRGLLNWFKRGTKAQVDEATQASIDKTIKNMEAILPNARKNAGDFSDNAKDMFDKYDNEEIIGRLRNYFDAGGTPDSGDVQWLRTLMKGGDDLEGLATKKSLWDKIGKTVNGKRFDPGSYDGLDRNKLKRATDEMGDAINKAEDFTPRQKTIMKYGMFVGGGLTGFAMFMGLGGSDFLEKWANFTTGLDCDEKAGDRGFEENSDEYAEAVKSCQEGSMNQLLKLGYGALAVVGFVGLIAVTRAIPKRKAQKEEPEEEEDTPEDEE